MRVGIYGGSFDPPHVGHLILAADACENLKLDRLLFVPAAVQPLKRDRTTPRPEQRLEMLKLAVANDPAFAIEAVELDRGGLSYTVDTLEELSPRYPGAELFLIIGEDALNELDSRWRRPERIREIAKLAVLRRHPERQEIPLPEGVAEASRRIVGISSSEIRERIRAGKSIHAFVPEGVERYIRSNGLYR